MHMARIEKYSTGIVGVIKHNIREFKDGKCPTNMEVDQAKKGDNYSLIRRGETAKEIEKYRKQIMKEVFHYNRKNIVLCNEVVCTLPADCPPDQEKLFFEESYKYICSTLPMGEKSVILAEVHCDEGKVMKDGVTVAEGAHHLHVMYIPAVPDSKHKGFDFRLCSDELTKRAVLKQWHPDYQKWLDDAGVKATVASGVTSGKGISVKSLKEISKETGLSLEQIKSLEKENQQLYQKLMEKEQEVAVSHHTISKQDSIIMELRDYAASRSKEVEALKERIRDRENDLSREKMKDAAADREKAALQEKLQEKEVENQQLKTAAREVIADKDRKLEAANEKLAEKDKELAQARERIRELEEERQRTVQREKEQEQTWGNDSWGSNQGWGSQSKSIEEEKLW